MGRMLWALEPPADAGTLGVTPDPQRGIQPWVIRHLRDQSVLSILLQHHGIQRTYLTLDGCTGCAVERCAPGCRVELLRRQIQATASTQFRLRAVPYGLTVHPLTTAVLCWPTRQARALDGSVLQAGGWPVSRLLVWWSPGFRGMHRVVALVAAQGDGADLRALLARWGWASIPISRALYPPLIARPMPPAALGVVGWWTRQTPWLLVPGNALPPVTDAAGAGESPARQDTEARDYDPAEPHPESQPAPPLPVMDVVHDELDALLHGQTLFPTPVVTRDLTDAPPPAPTGTAAAHADPSPTGTVPPAPSPTDPSPTEQGMPTTDAVPPDAVPPTPSPVFHWPPGPGRITPKMLAHLFALVQRHPEITREGKQGDPGLSKGRLKKIDADAGIYADTLLVWFDLAGILEPPKRPESPWSDARPLRAEPDAWYIQQLSLTPLPDAATVRAVLEGTA